MLFLSLFLGRSFAVVCCSLNFRTTISYRFISRGPYTMLRLPVSTIGLTPEDNDDFEARFETRRSLRRQNCVRTPSVRLNVGPGQRASHAVVTEDINMVGGRIESRIAQANNEGNVAVMIDAVACGQGRAAPIQSSVEMSESHQHTPSATVSNWQTEDFQTSCPHLYGQQDDRFDNLTVDDQPNEQPQLDGVNESREGPAATPEPAISKETGNIYEDVCPTEPPPRYSPPPFSSARARRHQIFHDSAIQQELIQHRHHERIPSHPPGTLLPFRRHPVRELMLPVYDGVDVSLDPGAPVFVPRTRFGSATGSSVNELVVVPDTQENINTHDLLNLRIRPTSEQNVDLAIRGRLEPSSSPAEQRRPRNGRNSRTSDQNDILPRQTRNLDRYPILRPNPRPLVAESATPGQGVSFVPMRNFSLVSHPDFPPTPAVIRSQYEVRHVVATHYTAPANYDDMISRSTSSSLSALRHSSTSNVLGTTGTPFPLPHSHSRGGPLSWSRNHVTADTSRVPSIVSSTVSGINERMSSRQSSTPGPSQWEGFARSRSPLEQLTEDLSRLSATLGRPRSDGRSLRRTFGDRPRISLLSGDPFRQDSSPHSASVSPLTLDTTLLVETVEGAAAIPPDISARASHASPMVRTSSSAFPSTPPLYEPQSYISSTTAGASPPFRTITFPQSPTSRVLSLATSSTPKIKIYNDAEPPTTQPQTPADVYRSIRRRHGQSGESTHWQEPVLIAQVMTSSPTTPNPGGDGDGFGNTMPFQRVAARTPTASQAGAPDPSRSMNARRWGEHAENNTEDMEGHLQSLQEDRQTWLERREDGSLDVTPPREGRFERYLS